MSAAPAPASVVRKIASGRLRIPSMAELDEKVRAGLFQMHAFPQGFVITEIKDCGAERVMVVHLLIGEGFAEWAEECVARLNDFAKQHGCAAMEASCRPGLVAMLKPLGWKPIRRVPLRKEVS